MARIRGKDSKPELCVRCILHKLGYRFRLHNKQLPGKPDICLPKYKTVIFIHGCYWHRHDCKKGRSFPATNANFWEAKFNGNVERDKRNLSDLEHLGWKTLVIWECEIKEPLHLQKRLQSFLKQVLT